MNRKKMLADFEPDAVQPWDKQVWEGATSHDRFRRFYLPQTLPRFVNEAYRRWKRSEGDEVEDNDPAPRRWSYWATAKTDDGQRIPDSQTWRERADLYDRHMAIVTQFAKEEWARQVAQDDFSDGTSLREFARLVLEQGPNFIKSQRRFVRGTTKDILGADGQTYQVQVTADREVITMALDSQAAVQALKLASNIQRKAADVADPVTRMALTDAEGDDLPAMADVVAALRAAKENEDRVAAPQTPDTEDAGEQENTTD